MSEGRGPAVYVLDDDGDLADAVARCLRRGGHRAEAFTDPAKLLRAFDAAPAPCLVSDMMMGATNGFDVVRSLRERHPTVSAIFMTAWPKVSDAVDSVRDLEGVDYLAKPIDEERLLAAVGEAVARGRTAGERERRLAELTAREREVFDLLVLGHSSKAVAARLDISPRTVDDHRAKIAAKVGTHNVAEMIALMNDGLAAS